MSAVAAGASHTCAVVGAGEVRCWGAGSAGQLGLGDTLDLSRPSPAAVGTAGPATSVAAGAVFSCALLATGSVTCWGANESGQLGTGSGMARVLSPGAPVALGAKATAIAAGAAHACALLATGSVYCWGANENGQLGAGDFAARSKPTLVDLGSDMAKAIAARGAETCVVLRAGRVKCWGRGASGQLGQGVATNLPAPPAVAIDIGTGRLASGISVGGDFACSLLDIRQARCWGDNGHFQLGSSFTGPAYGDRPGEMGDALPTTVQGGGRSAMAIASGRAHSCVVLDTGDVRCWGDNSIGQLGAGDADPHSFYSNPTATVDLGGGP